MSTVGVDLGKWKCKKSLKFFAKKSSFPPIEFLTWDFAGQVYTEARYLWTFVDIKCDILCAG